VELKDYLQILKEARTQIFLTTLGVVLIAFLVTVFIPSHFEGSFSVYITKETQESTPEFEYDQYYALKAKDELSKFVEEYLKNPAVSSEILKKADVNPEDYFLPLRRHFFQVYALSSQEVQINFKLKTPDKAEKVAAKTHSKLNETFRELFSKKDKTQYRLKRSRVNLARAGFSPALNSLLGAIAGAFLGVFVALFRHYLQ
jgi:capsular polysaccharide biosynthesis protein